VKIEGYLQLLMAARLTATERHLPYEITCHTNTGERAPP